MTAQVLEQYVSVGSVTSADGTPAHQRQGALRAIIPLAIKKRERLQKYALLPGTIREHVEAARRNNDFPTYAHITTPVLLIVGKEADTTGAGQAPGRLKNILPNSELVHFPKLDHFGPEKDPAAIAAAITAFFLDRSGS